jgi:hypothetical protein
MLVLFAIAVAKLLRALQAETIVFSEKKCRVAEIITSRQYARALMSLIYEGDINHVITKVMGQSYY